jgi:uncharacterized protein involved in tolerance to divalent cations
MKLALLGLVLIIASFSLKGQAPFPNKDEIKQFTQSKTCVVLEENQLSTYNVYIKQAVKAFWTITPYEFIEVSEFNVRRMNPEYSFIVLTQTNYQKDKSGTFYNFINLLQGKKGSRLGDMPEICAVPLACVSEEDIEYSYKLGAILLFMQKHASMISDDPSLTGRKYLKYYNKNIPEVAGKTILVQKADLAPEISTIDKIKAIYPYKIEIVTEEEIMKAVADKTPNTLILHKVGPADDEKAGYCFKMLIGTDDSDMYYYNQHLIDKSNPDGLLPADLKRLSR